jgi:flagellar hook-basal body complex protein FliE
MNVPGITGAEAGRTMAQGADAAASAADESFQDMFARVAAAARDSVETGEAAAIKGVSGETSVQNVVQAMMTAEQQLKAAIAVRDRVVAAYQEISRMQI